MPRRGLYLFVMPILALAWFFVFGVLYPTGPAQAAMADFILSGSSTPTGNFCVDDDIYVYLNGALIYSDIDKYRASCNNRPISFRAEAGGLLRITAIDSVGSCRAIYGL